LSRASVAARLAFCVATENVTSTSVTTPTTRSARRRAAGTTSTTVMMATDAAGTARVLATPDTKAPRRLDVNVAVV
jgi:hypothetical protein